MTITIKYNTKVL